MFGYQAHTDTFGAPECTILFVQLLVPEPPPPPPELPLHAVSDAARARTAAAAPTAFDLIGVPFDGVV